MPTEPADDIALVVSPKRAVLMLDTSMPTLYELIHAGKIDSYKDGGSRKITVASIRRYIAERLAASSQSHQPPAAGQEEAGGRLRRRAGKKASSDHEAHTGRPPQKQ